MEDTGNKHHYEEVISAEGAFSFNWRELWQYRELLFIFTWRDIKVKYKQTFFGVLWAVLQPVMMALVVSLTIGRVVPKHQTMAVTYPVFVYSGLIFWYLFANGIQNASNSMLSNENIIKKIYFPRLIIPLSSICVALFDFLITFGVYLILLLFYQVPVDLIKGMCFLPLALVLNVMTVFGVGTFFAALNIKFRDFRYVIPFLLQFLLFTCPVFYPSGLVQNKWLSLLLMLNPINAVLELSRGMFSSSLVHWESVVYGVLVALLSLTFGLYYFRKTEHYFADIS